MMGAAWVEMLLDCVTRLAVRAGLFDAGLSAKLADELCLRMSESPLNRTYLVKKGAIELASPPLRSRVTVCQC